MGSVTTERGDFEKFLEELPLMLRGKALAQAVRRGGNVVKNRARQLVPVGDPNHKPDSKPLKDTIVVKIVRFENDTVVVALIGPRSPDGNHGHLVEGGHRVRARGKKGEGPGDYTGARVEGKEFMAPAADQTIDEQTAAIVAYLRNQVEEYRIA